MCDNSRKLWFVQSHDEKKWKVFRGRQRVYRGAGESVRGRWMCTHTHRGAKENRILLESTDSERISFGNITLGTSADRPKCIFIHKNFFASRTGSAFIWFMIACWCAYAPLSASVCVRISFTLGANSDFPVLLHQFFSPVTMCVLDTCGRQARKICARP